MVSRLAAILVVLLLLPGLALVTAVVVRYLFRGSRAPRDGQDTSEQPSAGATPPREVD